METGAAFLLGAVQGLTEFLPVSSSGHLVMARALLPEGAIHSPGVLFEVVVHLGTLAAALIYLRREVAALLGSLGGANRTGRKLLGMLVTASIPAALIGFAFAGPIRGLFQGTGAAGVGLALTGTALLGFRGLLDQGERKSAPRPPAGSFVSGPSRMRDALAIGAAQALAILPGVSRSGSTILTGRACGLEPADAARFSFLLSAPVIAGGALLEGSAALGGESLAGPGAGSVAVELAVGFAAAFLAGSVALAWVFGWLAERRFHQFGWYCLAVGGLGIGLASA